MDNSADDTEKEMVGKKIAKLLLVLLGFGRAVAALKKTQYQDIYGL